MKKTITTLMLASASLVAVGCATAPKEPAMTPMEIQSMQSRSYEENKSVVFPSVISVFQDLGYTVEQADLETGFISALSATKGSGIMTSLLLGASTTSQTGATAYIEQIGDESRVRLNFVVKKGSSSKYGNSRNDTPILEPEPYQSAFEKIETAVFVRSAQ